jgi:hypothetical protein
VSGDLYRLRQARRMLDCPHVELSRVRGVSEWIPQDLQDGLLANLAVRGFQVRS